LNLRDNYFIEPTDWKITMALTLTPADFITTQAQQNSFSQRAKRMATWLLTFILSAGLAAATGRLILLIPGPRYETFSLAFLFFCRSFSSWAYYLSIYEQVLALSTNPEQQEQVRSHMRKYGLHK
jgi:hypothetical protein